MAEQRGGAETLEHVELRMASRLPWQMPRIAVRLALAACAVLLALISGAITPQAHAAEESAETPVIVIATGGLQWSDINATDTPTLWELTRTGSSAALSIVSVYANTCPVDAFLGLSAGARAATLRDGASTTPPSQRRCPPSPSVVDNVVSDWNEYVSFNSSNSASGALGAFGAALDGTGECSMAIGPNAPLAIANRGGAVSKYAAYSKSNLERDLSACPVAVVDVTAVIDRSRAASNSNPASTRREQVAYVESAVAAVVAAGSPDADFMVASLSDDTTSPGLGLLIAAGPHFGPGELYSPATRRVGLAQAPDITATVVSLRGGTLSAPEGSVLRTRGGASTEDATKARVRSLLDTDQAATKVETMVAPFFQALGVLELLAFLAGWWVWKLPDVGGSRRKATRWLATAGTAFAAVPVSTFLANLVPWWREANSALVLSGVVVAFAAAITLFAFVGPWRTAREGPITAVAGITMVVLTIDILTGGRLQISSLMGLQPIVGGRFYGVGNVTFGLYAVATLFFVAGATAESVRAGRRRQAALFALAVGGFAILVDGAPFWGADGGGPPAFILGLAYLIVAILGLRMTWLRWGLVLMAIGAFVALMAGLDALRPAGERSHLGQFAITLQSGGGLNIIARKVEQNIGLFISGMPWTLLVPIGLLLFVGAMATWPHEPSSILRLAFHAVPTLRAAVWGSFIVLVVGLLINDTGIAIPAAGAALLIPALIGVVNESANYALRTTGLRRAQERTPPRVRSGPPKPTNVPGAPPQARPADLVGVGAAAAGAAGAAGSAATLAPPINVGPPQVSPRPTSPPPARTWPGAGRGIADDDTERFGPPPPVRPRAPRGAPPSGAPGRDPGRPASRRRPFAQDSGPLPERPAPGKRRRLPPPGPDGAAPRRPRPGPGERTRTGERRATDPRAAAGGRRRADRMVRDDVPVQRGPRRPDFDAPRPTPGRTRGQGPQRATNPRPDREGQPRVGAPPRAAGRPRGEAGRPPRTARGSGFEGQRTPPTPSPGPRQRPPRVVQGGAPRRPRTPPDPGSGTLPPRAAPRVPGNRQPPPRRPRLDLPAYPDDDA